MSSPDRRCHRILSVLRLRPAGDVIQSGRSVCSGSDWLAQLQPGLLPASGNSQGAAVRDLEVVCRIIWTRCRPKTPANTVAIGKGDHLRVSLDRTSVERPAVLREIAIHVTSSPGLSEVLVHPPRISALGLSDSNAYVAIFPLSSSRNPDRARYFQPKLPAKTGCANF